MERAIAAISKGLAVFWAVAGPLVCFRNVRESLFAQRPLDSRAWALTAIVACLFGGIPGLWLAYGSWTLRPWARALILCFASGLMLIGSVFITVCLAGLSGNGNLSGDGLGSPQWGLLAATVTSVTGAGLLWLFTRPEARALFRKKVPDSTLRQAKTAAAANPKAVARRGRSIRGAWSSGECEAVVRMTRDELEARIDEAEARLGASAWAVFLGMSLVIGTMVGLAIIATVLWWPVVVRANVVPPPVLLVAAVLLGSIAIVMVWSRKVRAVAYCCPNCRAALVYGVGLKALRTGACPRCGTTLVEGAGA